MKYTIAGILIVDAAILIWTARSGSASEVATMAFALACVTFCGSLPIVAGVLSRRKKRDRASAATTETITLKSPRGPRE